MRKTHSFSTKITSISGVFIFALFFLKKFPCKLININSGIFWVNKNISVLKFIALHILLNDPLGFYI